MKAGSVLVLGGFDRSLLAFRGKLIEAMHTGGWQVTAAAPAEDPRVAGELRQIGARFQPVYLARTGLNPIADLRTFFSLTTSVLRVRPDVFLAYTLKPVGYGCVVAWACGVPRVYALITGLGSAFMSSGAKGSLLACFAGGLYRIALQRCEKVFVQNPDIARFLIEREIVHEPEKLVVVAGSGVDLNHFRFAPCQARKPRFLFLGRFLRDKGVFELIEAARDVRARHPEVEVVLVGGTDSNASSVSAEQIARWREEKIVTIEEPVADVRWHLRECTVLVLPSYHEGLPRAVLEALATGRAVITTDAIGCRETVRDPKPADEAGVRWGANGALVPVRDGRALAAAMLEFVRHPALAEQMGRESRRLAEQIFDVDRVNARIMAEMEMTPAHAAERPRLI